MLGKSGELHDLGDSNRTGNTCPKSGRWCCEDHVSVEISIRQGDIFPKCYHVAGHDAKWLYVKY